MEKGIKIRIEFQWGNVGLQSSIWLQYGSSSCIKLKVLPINNTNNSCFRKNELGMHTHAYQQEKLFLTAMSTKKLAYLFNCQFIDCVRVCVCVEGRKRLKLTQ